MLLPRWRGLHAPCVSCFLTCCQQHRGGEQASYSELPLLKQGKDGLGTEQEGERGGEGEIPS